MEWTSAADFQYDEFAITEDDDGSPSKNVRFLEVNPSLSPEGLLQCHLYISHLSRTHTALSYTWGSEQPWFPILVNSKFFKVRQNLYTFLALAREKYHSIPLWIDAICIDQYSLIERNHQVSFMSDIYSHANETLVWLGSGSEAIEAALPQLADALSGFNFNAHFNAAPSVQQISLQAFIDLAHLPYWSRTWVVQEYALSRVKTFLYGSVNISGNALALALHLISVNPIDKGGKVGRSPAQAFLSENFQLKLNYPSRKGLLYYYLRHSDSQCSDFHDHAYALRALVLDGHEFPVDYSLSRMEHMFSILNFCIRELMVFHRGVELQNEYLELYVKFARDLLEQLRIEGELKYSVEGMKLKRKQPKDFFTCGGFEGKLRLRNVGVSNVSKEDALQVKSEAQQLNSVRAFVRNELQQGNSEWVYTLYWLQSFNIVLVGRSDSEDIVARFQWGTDPGEDESFHWIRGEIYSYLADSDDTSCLRGVKATALDERGRVMVGSIDLEIQDTITGVLIFGMPDDERLRRIYADVLYQSSNDGSTGRCRIFTARCGNHEGAADVKVRWA